MDCFGRENGVLDCLAVEHGQSAGQAQADRADVCVGFAAVLIDASAKRLRPGHQLDVYFKPDDGLILGENLG